jgi:hypothetical protein
VRPRKQGRVYHLRPSAAAAIRNPTSVRSGAPTDLFAERRDETGEPTSGDRHRLLLVRPLSGDPAHQSVNGVRRSPQHPSPDAILGAPADGVRRRRRLGGWELCGLAHEPSDAVPDQA